MEILTNIALKILSPFIAIGVMITPHSTQVVQQPVTIVQSDTSGLEAQISSLQNELNQVKGRSFGASESIPVSVALFETSLASQISSSATSMTLVSGVDKTGTALASSTYGMIIDEGTASEEMVLADCTGTACTNMTRGISPITGTTTVASLQKSHRRGASVKITDGPQLMILTRLVKGIGTFPNLLSYTSGTNCSVGSGNQTICDKAYIDGVSVAGASNANTTTKGIIETSTAVEHASSTTTGGTGALLVAGNDLGTSTPKRGCDGTATAGALCSVIAQNNGKIDPFFISTTTVMRWSADDTYTGANTFTGLNTFSATSTFATTTNNGVNFGATIAQQYTCDQTLTGQILPVPVMLATTSNRVAAVDADVASTTNFMGFLINNCSQGTTGYVVMEGVVKGFSGLTAGAEYYVTDTSGTISTTPGTAEQYVGRAVTTGSIQVDSHRQGQYLGTQSLSCGSGTAVNQPWARNAWVQVSGTNGSPKTSTFGLYISKRGAYSASFTDAGEGGAGDKTGSAQWSGNTITTAGGITSCAGATAYYFN